MSNSTSLSEYFLKGGWIPISHEAHQSFLKLTRKKAVSRKAKYGGNRSAHLLPEVLIFKNFVESDGKILMGFREMLRRAEITDVPDFEALVDVLNEIIQQSPTYGTIGPPVYMVLAQAMNTLEGFSTFLHGELNKHFKAMFLYWTRYLLTAESRYMLTDATGGWFSAPALTAMVEHFDGKTFFEIFVSVNDPSTYYGFSSFDDFFNRQFRSNIRELQFPTNPDIINAACESRLYNIARNVGRSDEFWLKGEPYSLEHVLAGLYLDQFIGGTIFQGFLEVTGYHRWHSPVTGIIRKVVPIEGTYFAQSPAVINGSHFGSAPPAPGPDLATNPFLRSLAFITSITTRTLVFIESDNPKIGLMCFIAIGMTEISTCTLNPNIKEGNRITRGDEVGMFQFGGSSHALVFGPNANITFFPEYSQPGQHVKVRAAIAGVS